MKKSKSSNGKNDKDSKPNGNKGDKGTDIVCIIDASGSMNAMKAEAIGGFNSFLAKQQELQGKATLSLIFFDHEYMPQFMGRDIQEARPLNDKSYVPRGTTALLDAIGRSIEDEKRRINNLPEEDRPGKIIFMILTDGQENSSQDYRVTVVRTGTGTVSAKGSEVVGDGTKFLKEIGAGDILTVRGHNRHVVTSVEGDSKLTVSVPFSKEFSGTSFEIERPKIKDAIGERQAAGWDFVFLGANQDSFTIGAQMGVRAVSTMNYTADAIGTQSAFGSMSNYISRSRMGLSRGFASPDGTKA